MRNSTKSIFKTLVIGAMLLSSIQLMAAGQEIADRLAKFSLIKSAFACNISAERIAKTYIYIGEKIGTREAKKEQKAALKKFESNYKKLNESINNPKIKNLLTFIGMSSDELKDLIKKPYSLDNAQIVLDLVATISEGSRHVAAIYQKELGPDSPVQMKGLRPLVESIPKYYIAYQSGIKDENTIKLMKKTVKNVNDLINFRVKFSKNTVAMNQAINKADRLWKIVYKFYLDIDEGGLPFIVFKTTSDLQNILKVYVKALLKQQGDELKAGK